MVDASLAIDIQGLTKTYLGKKGKVTEALKGIHIAIPRGGFYGLLGPNGAGKSTLINILAGIVVKTSGRVSICGYDIDTAVRQAKKAIGVVPQELLLDPFFPPYEALEYMAGYYGIPPSRRRTKEIIKAVGLEAKAYAPARSLSGGMRRRLMVAKALVHSPEVLILDEPTAGVDVELRTQLWEYVKDLNQKGTTILLTTHYLEEAETLCDNIAIINHGRIVAEGSKKQIMQTIDRKKLLITPNEKLTGLPDALGQFDSVLTEYNQVAITYSPQKTTVGDILAVFQATGLTVKDLSTEEPDLEDVFRHVVRM